MELTDTFTLHYNITNYFLNQCHLLHARVSLISGSKNTEIGRKKIYVHEMAG